MSEYLTVSKLNLYIKSVVEADFSLMNISVIGEVSSLTKHYTGHYYFTLKDNESQIKCMMFASYTQNIDFNLQNGNKILVQGYIGVYDKGGVYQLYCRKISLYGEGEYLLKLAKLKEKLEKEGLFSLPKKKLPLLPKRIGVVSAKTGAAIFDYINTIRKRINTEIYLFPCLVQGEEASKSILKAIKEALNYELDLLVITRGGGSKEDLRAFNDEELVRFVSQINIPTIAAVGHKIDTTLIDYVVDKSCITPTDAAMNSTPSYEEMIDQLSYLQNLLQRKLIRLLENKQMKIAYLIKDIDLKSPLNELKLKKQKIENIDKKIHLIMKNYLIKKYNYLTYINNKINYLNPLELLNNGYTLSLDQNKKQITSIKQIKINDTINVIFKDGEIKAKVEEIKNDF